MGLKVYLAGRVKGLDDEGRGWREDVVKQLEAIAEWNGKKIEIFDPTKYFSYSDKRHKTVRQIKEYYMNRLSKCDIMLLNCNDTEYSIGTAQEVQFAVDHNIPVIGFGTTNMYNWIATSIARSFLAAWLKRRTIFETFIFEEVL